MFVLYVVAYLDRINVGFAALQMRRDLGFTDTVYGLGAGIFFIGYFLFEVPSNLIMHRVGARVWMARIMITWGVISAAMMLVRGVRSFYALRFLLGAAEAGFFPGMILYLTYWFPAAEQARAVARFMTATAIAGVVGGPISGKILEQLGGLGGLAGWQWLFLLEGLPAVGFGLVALGYLTDRPADADWLAPAGRAWLTERMRREHAERSGRHGHSVIQALARRRGGLLSLGALGMWSALGPFWARSATFASGRAAAGAIALVNSVGNLGGFLGPFLVGLVKEHTDGFAGGLAVLAGWLVLAGVIALGLRDEAVPPA